MARSKINRNHRRAKRTGRKRLSRKELDIYFQRDAPKLQKLISTAIAYLKLHGITGVVTRSQYRKLKEQVTEIALEMYFKGDFDDIRPTRVVVCDVPAWPEVGIEIW